MIPSMIHSAPSARSTADEMRFPVTRMNMPNPTQMKMLTNEHSGHLQSRPGELPAAHHHLLERVPPCAARRRASGLGGGDSLSLAAMSQPGPLLPVPESPPRQRRTKAGAHLRSALQVVLLAIAVRFVAACTSTPPPALPALPEGTASVSYDAQVRRVFEQRCVVCHSCYDAPCQLVLSSHTGLTRGASKQVVYDTDRLTAAQPTRLYVDAQTTAEWRQLGFFPVLGDPAAAQSASLLTLMLELGRAHPFPPGEKLPASVGLDIDRALSCAQVGGVRRLRCRNIPSAACRTGWRHSTLPSSRCWPAGSAKAHRRRPRRRRCGAATTAQVARWETFLNGDSLKQRITARYLYEHWFVAHLYFEDQPAGPFFRVVRSTTPPGVAVDEIATRRPYDAPGVEHSGIACGRSTATIVHKTHIVYPLSDAKMQRLAALFLEADWQPTRLPSYDAVEARIRSISFDQIPGSLALPVPARRRAVLRHDVHPRPGVPRTGGGRRDRGSLLRRLSRSRSRLLGHRSQLPRARRSSI